MSVREHNVLVVERRALCWRRVFDLINFQAECPLCNVECHDVRSLRMKRKRKVFAIGNPIRRMHCEFWGQCLQRVQSDPTHALIWDIPHTLCIYDLVDLVWIYIRVWVQKLWFQSTLNILNESWFFFALLKYNYWLGWVVMLDNMIFLLTLYFSHMIAPC